MRALTWMVAAALLLPLAASQTELLDDPAGDAAVHAHGTPTPVHSPANQAVDLRALRVHETPEGFDFTIETEGFAHPEFSMNFEIRFTHGAESYLVEMYGILAGTVGDLTGYLLRATANAYERVVQLEPVLEPSRSTITVPVPRHHLTNEHGAVPGIGSHLRDIHVLSRGTETLYILGEDGAIGLRDRMPNAGEGASYASTVGLQQSGDARLTSDEPMRFSNGEATTFVYTIVAHNDGSDAQAFAFHALDVPAGWEVVFPSRSVSLDGGDAKEVPVVVQTPFRHQHGDAATFRVEMVGQSDRDDVGRIELGVRYPDTPQPSGHHPRLWLHSQVTDRDPFSLLRYAVAESIGGAGQQDAVYMNTLEEDPLSAGIDVDGAWCDTLWAEPPSPSPVGGDTIPQAVVYCWMVPLSPTLRMGLDFDVSGTGTIEVPIHSAAPADRAWLGGQLLYFPPDVPIPGQTFGDASAPEGAVVVAQLHPDQNVSFQPDSTVQMSATIVPTQDGDLIPYQRGGSLWLLLNVTQERPETVIGPKTDKPAVTPGGMLELPLVDYADPVADIFGDARLLVLRASHAQRMVNPGETVVFEVTIQNRQSDAADFDLRLFGGGADWGRIVTASTVRVESGGTETALVAVAAPADATDGVRADLILEATSAIDPDIRSLVRLVAEVDDEADHEDQSGQLADASAGGKRAPAASLAAFFLALACLARRRT